MDSERKYLKNYDKYFNSLVNKNIVLLELGVYKGDSIRLWSDYFKKGTIIGIDINWVNVEQYSHRIHFFKGSQNNKLFLDSFSNIYGPYNIIIDDASHIGEFTKTSFWHLFDNYLRPGGIFVIEDWGTGYYNKFSDGCIYKQKTNKLREKIRGFLDNSIDNYCHPDTGRKFFRKTLLRLLKLFRKVILKKRFTSHNYGLVGFVKELIDEMGLDIITSSRGNPGITSRRKFEKIEIFPGQVFIIKR